MAPHVSLHAFRSQASVSSFNSCMPRPDGCTKLTRIGFRQEEQNGRPYSLEHDFRGTALQHPKSRIIKDQGNTTHTPTIGQFSTPCYLKDNMPRPKCIASTIANPSQKPLGNCPARKCNHGNKHSAPLGASPSRPFYRSSIVCAPR